MQIPSTVTEQVENAEALELSYRIMNPYAIIKDNYSGVNITVPFSSLTNKYRNLLSQIVTTIELTDSEQEEYIFRPKALSEYLYGTTEFWNDILILNGAFSVIDFKPMNVKVYDPEYFKQYLNEILILEGLI